MAPYPELSSLFLLPHNQVLTPFPGTPALAGQPLIRRGLTPRTQPKQEGKRSLVDAVSGHQPPLPRSTRNTRGSLLSTPVLEAESTWGISGTGEQVCRGRGWGSGGNRTQDTENTVPRGVGAHLPRESLHGALTYEAGKMPTAHPCLCVLSLPRRRARRGAPSRTLPVAAFHTPLPSCSLSLAAGPRSSHQQGCGFPGSGVTHRADARPFSHSASNDAPPLKRVSD